MAEEITEQQVKRMRYEDARATFEACMDDLTDAFKALREASNALININDTARMEADGHDLGHYEAISETLSDSLQDIQDTIYY